MARMKFYCDAERCIECNACVTACKNEHEIPWGVNRRRVVTIKDGEQGERSLSVACMHCSDAPCAAVCPVDCFYTTEDGVVLHDKDICIGCGYCFYACPFGAPQFPENAAFRQEVKWISVLSVRVVLKKIIARMSIKNMVVIACPRVSYHSVLKCVLPRHCWLVMQMCYPIFIESVLSIAVPVYSTGVLTLTMPSSVVEPQQFLIVY